MEKINPNGGAIAISHPLGMSMFMLLSQFAFFDVSFSWYSSSCDWSRGTQTQEQEITVDFHVRIDVSCFGLWLTLMFSKVYRKWNGSKWNLRQ